MIVSFFLGLHAYTHNRLLEYPSAYMQHNLCKNSPKNIKYNHECIFYFVGCELLKLFQHSLYILLCFKFQEV